MKSILDRSFRYTPSAETDLRKTFARIRRAQRVGASEAAHNNNIAHLKRESGSRRAKRLTPGKL